MIFCHLGQMALNWKSLCLVVSHDMTIDVIVWFCTSLFVFLDSGF